MVRVPGGTFEVADQVTTVKVRVTVTDFLLGATEVTQAEYQAITGANESVYKGPTRPVENVSWRDAIRYCNLRSVKEKLRPCYDLASGRRDELCDGYRLPTDAEWVHAAGPMPRPELMNQSGNLGDPATKSVAVLEKALARGTVPARSFPANAAGLFDMLGNVWEWCDDYFDVRSTPAAVRNPAGPLSGLEKVIRGGSFVSSTSRWSRDYRSSMRPDSRSRYTGFRVARTIPQLAVRTIEPETFFRPYNQPPRGFEISTGSLSVLAAAGTSADAWAQIAGKIRSRWDGLLAIPKAAFGNSATRLVRTVQQQNFSGEIIELEMESGVWEKIYVLRPRDGTGVPRPVMIVPFYDIDTPAAADLGGRNFASDRGVNAFAYTAAQHGYIAVAVRWFGESYGESYSEAVANLALRHPGSTGLGKWVADARRVVDFVSTLPDADASRIGIMGHSLGGKMALYAAAFEPRIAAVVSSELGIGLKFSNYDDYWYLGDKLAKAPRWH